jgi:hypothetical protein
MATKTTQRKHSVLVTEAIVEALAPFKHLTTAQLARAIADYKERKAALDAALEHIKVIRHLGVLDANRGFTDADIAQLIKAKELVEREKVQPGEFVSAGVFSAAQASNRIGEIHQPERDTKEIRNKARHLGYFDLPKRDPRRKEVLNKIIEELHLWSDNKATTAESKYHNLRRILK